MCKNLDTWCPHCSGNAKLSIEEARKIATKNKGLCLSETYNGAHTKLKWQCEKKHEWYATFDKVKNLDTSVHGIHFVHGRDKNSARK
jgi:hypothetical protein